MPCLERTLHTSRVVALLERVQGGIIGQTLSSFGITGLYITFVFGIGRFLRFSTQHARMRIPFEDLPTTKRLIALCQVYALRALPTPAELLRSHASLPAYPAACAHACVSCTVDIRICLHPQRSVSFLWTHSQSLCSCRLYRDITLQVPPICSGGVQQAAQRVSLACRISILQGLRASLSWRRNCTGRSSISTARQPSCLRSPGRRPSRQGRKCANVFVDLTGSLELPR